MKKLTLLLSFTVLGASLFSAQQAAASTCTRELHEAIRAYGSPSSDRREVTDLKVLSQGEIFQYGRLKTFGPFSEPVLIALVNGSYHSGYFVEAYLLKNATCELISREVVYSE